MGERGGRPLLIVMVAICFLAASFNVADAMRYELGPEYTLDFDVTVKYGAGFRVQKRDADRVANPNTDDANRNFDKWEMFNNKISLLADIELKTQDFGFLVRPKVMYDHVYDRKNSNDSPLTNNALQAGKINFTDEWADEVEDVHMQAAELLDAYAYGTFRIADHVTTLRLGRQTIQWGENLLITGIAGAMAHVDYDAATAAGTEVKEILLPSESVFLQTALTEDLSFEAYYQFKWYRHKFMEAGSYFASADLLDDAGYNLLFAPGGPALNRGDDDKAKDGGQYGFALRYFAESLNATEFGIYMINYHAKAPVGPAMDLVAGTFSWVYPEDMKVYAFSFGTLIGDCSLTGEFHYHKDHYYGINDKENYWQAQTSWYFSGTAPRGIADSYSFLGELAVSHARDIAKATDKDLGAVISARAGLDWINVLTNLDMGCDVAYADKLIENKIAGAKDSSTFGLSMDFTYKSIYKFDIKYQMEIGDNNTYEDRDWIKIGFTYTF